MKAEDVCVAKCAVGDYGIYPHKCKLTVGHAGPHKCNCLFTWGRRKKRK